MDTTTSTAMTTDGRQRTNRREQDLEGGMRTRIEASRQDGTGRRTFFRADGARSAAFAVGAALATIGMLTALPAAAQLDEKCTVSALNRTAPVAADGVWVLPNVPANRGPVRVRATCVDNGVTRSGESELIVIPANGTIEVQEIRFTDPTPIPSSLQLSAPRSELGAAGETVQVAVTALYPDGGSADASGPGTEYRSTNPAIASVDAAGLVTAHASGRVLVSASREGAIGILLVAVVASGDTDGDGMPDDYEVANGLDPGNPADALGDPDRDGLTSLDEFQRGLKPFDADTDADGLLDGDEIRLYLTDPLVFDSDGDEVSDGLEVRAGSDPLDPESLNLAGILAGLTVQPAAVDLVVNTALGEASRRLDVRGRLIDGRTIDLRRRSRGTNYLSSDLAVASFGAEDGRIFAGANGSATVTVSNNGYSAAVPVSVVSFAPAALSFLALPGYPNGIDVAGGYAYVASGQAGLLVVDVSAPELPRLAATADTPGNANDLRVDGGYAYVADGDRGLSIFDVRDPRHPALAGRIDTPGRASDVAVLGGRAYVADGDAGLAIFDVRDPAAPVFLGSVGLPGRARAVDTDGLVAVVAAGDSGLQVVDVTDPSNPVRLGGTATRPNFVSHAADVVLRGRLAYVADGADFNLGGLRIVDLREPSNPALIATSGDQFALAGLALDGPLALAADYFFVNAVPIFNTGVTPPAFAAQLDFSASPSFRDDNGNAIALQGGVAYMVGTREIQDDGVAGDGGLHIGRYRVADDTLGVAPRVELTFPLAGATAPERARLRVRADASDDLQVASVEFLLDGVPVFVDGRAPFEALVTVPAGVPSFTLGAVALDYGGNRGTAEPVTVTIGPDTTPRAVLLTPVPGQRHVEGVTFEAAASASDDVEVTQVEFLVDGQPWDLQVSPPYRTAIWVPVGGEELTVQVIATDSAGQTGASEIVTVGIDDDPPPFVTVLAPTPGASVVAGSRLRVDVGATDPQGISVVRLAVDGVPYGEDYESPYQFSLVVPDGAELVLSASAEDSIGQPAAAEARYAIVPDPATTATGRVVDGQGNGIAGAAVRCAGVSGVSGAGGSFSVPGVPTVRGRISCGAISGAGAEAAEGRSAALPPVAGGETEVGDVVVAARLLYLGSGNGSAADQPGRLLVYDGVQDRYLPWSASIPPGGLSGLAFDDQGRLFATTQPFQGQPSFAPGTAGASGAPKPRSEAVTFPGGESNSRLLRLDPETGAILATVGPVAVEIEGGAGFDQAARFKSFLSSIAVQDLTFDRERNRFYALSQNSGGRLYTVDGATGVAAELGTGLSYSNAALAFGPDGLLYLLSSSGDLFLSTIDPASGAVLATDPVGGTPGPSSVGGMFLRPGTGTFLVTAAFGGTGLYDLDPLTRQISEHAAPTGAVEGGILALALREVSGSPVSTTLSGLTVDGDGAPVVGAEVSSLGAFGATGPDGRFELPGVTVRTGSARVAVRLGPDLAFSAAVPPVAGGLTDLGTIVLGAPACVSGTFFEFRCVGGTMLSPLDLYLEDDQGTRTPAGQIVPDLTGRFCADLRPGRRYIARREDVECYCGRVGPCEAALSVTDPGAAGACGGPDSTCQDLGDVQMRCDFFCGS